MNFAAEPSSLANALPSFSLRSAIATLPPAAAIMRAVAPPRPDAPPVIRNTLPPICIRLFLFRHGRRVMAGDQPLLAFPFVRVGVAGLHRAAVAEAERVQPGV